MISSLERFAELAATPDRRKRLSYQCGAKLFSTRTRPSRHSPSFAAGLSDFSSSLRQPAAKPGLATPFWAQSRARRGGCGTACRGLGSPERAGTPTRTPADPLRRSGRVDFRNAYPCDVPELGAFWTGAVGYFGYDVVRLIERLPKRTPARRRVSRRDVRFHARDGHHRQSSVTCEDRRWSEHVTSGSERPSCACSTIVHSRKSRTLQRGSARPGALATLALDPLGCGGYRARRASTRTISSTVSSGSRNTSVPAIAFRSLLARRIELDGRFRSRLSVQGAPRAQSIAVHVPSRAGRSRDSRKLARAARAARRQSRDTSSDRRHSAARDYARATMSTLVGRAARAIRRSARSTSCSSISGGTTSDASRGTGPLKSPS